VTTAAAAPPKRTTARKPPAAPAPEAVDEDLEQYEPVLDLDTVVPDRPTARIKTAEDREGTLYEMRLPAEFGIEEEQLFRSELREYSELMEGNALTSAAKKRLKARLNHLSQKILLAPPEVLEQLSDRQRQAVVTNFTGALFREDVGAVNQATQPRTVSSTTES
jgi:hypothetical protein